MWNNPGEIVVSSEGEVALFGGATLSKAQILDAIAEPL